MEKIKVIIDWEDNYGAASDEIAGCVATHKTFEGVKEAYASTLAFHIEGMHPHEIPHKLQGEYELEFELTAQALLHHFDGILTRAAISRVTGINERQLGHYMTRHRIPRLAQRSRIIDGLHRIGKELTAVV